MSADKLYIDKELSWLSFNERVLQEAADKTVPLIERIRFLGIFSNNLDEFYKVRFADVKRQILINRERGGQWYLQTPPLTHAKQSPQTQPRLR